VCVYVCVYSSSDIRMIIIRMGIHVTLIGEQTNTSTYRVSGWEDVDWVNLAQDRDQWQTVVRMMSIVFRKMRGIS
jgi:hypothetical protein